MNRSDKCCLQCHENSIPQMTHTAYSNVATEPSQNNFLQQQNQPRSQPQQQKHPFQHQQPFNQSMQSQFINYPLNQSAGNCYSTNPQQCQPNLSYTNGQPGPNPCQTPYQMAYNSPSARTASQQPYESLSPAVLEQIRNACMAPTGPIFILPNNSTPAQVQPSQQPTMGQLSTCPGMRVPCGTSSPSCYSQPSCIPYPVPIPMFNPFSVPTTNIKEITNCNCNPRQSNEPCKASNCSTPYSDEHYCVATTDDTICAKKSCPSSINLQALASQLLAIQGIISCAATRLVLRKVPGSNVTNSMDETVERARRSINALTQDQLLTESRNAQQINALINLHMTANPPPNVIPILTTIQLKVNLLKSHVENLINCHLMENQSVGAEGSKGLDIMTLSLKCDKDLRTMLATLRQKECDERVNLNFAPYHSQRAIAECRLRNIESKIRQVESEMHRRRSVTVPRIPVRYEDPGIGCRGPSYTYPGTLPCLTPSQRGTIPQPQYCESPDPFQIEVRSTRRLNLKPHVGSPETTYSHSPGPMHNQKESVFAQQNKHESDDNKNRANEQNDKQTNNQDENMDDDDDDNCDCCCDCSKSSDEDSPNTDKKKLRVTKKKTNQVDDDNTKVEKKKTVDFVRKSVSTKNTTNAITTSAVEIEMEMRVKDINASSIYNGKNNKLEMIRSENGNKLEQDIVNENIDENNKREIILLHDSKTSKLLKNPSITINRSSENEKYSALLKMPVENIVSHESRSGTENRFEEKSINTPLVDKNSLNTSKADEILQENNMDLVVEDLLRTIENGLNDGIEVTERKIFQELNRIDSGTSVQHKTGFSDSRSSNDSCSNRISHSSAVNVNNENGQQIQCKKLENE